MAFAIATRDSFREAFERAERMILEPIMNVEVTVPSEY
jgi:translation elongation factor EF-G